MQQGWRWDAACMCADFTDNCWPCCVTIRKIWTIITLQPPTEQGRVRLFLGQIARGAHHHHAQRSAHVRLAAQQVACGHVGVLRHRQWFHWRYFVRFSGCGSGGWLEQFRFLHKIGSNVSIKERTYKIHSKTNFSHQQLKQSAEHYEIVLHRSSNGKTIKCWAACYFGSTVQAWWIPGNWPTWTQTSSAPSGFAVSTLTWRRRPRRFTTVPLLSTLQTNVQHIMGENKEWYPPVH